MKKREKIVIGILTLVLVANLVVIAVMASSENRMIEGPNAESKPAEWVEREDLAKSKSVTLFDEEKTVKKVTYDISRKLTENILVDVYRDKEDVEFRFEGDRFVAMVNHSILEEDREQGEAPKTDEMVKRARAHIKEVFNEDLAEYEQDEIYGEGTSRVHIFFTKKFGKDKFVSGPTVSVSMTEDGTIYSAAMPYEIYLNFDESLLDDITYDRIEDFIKEELSNKYKEKLISFEIDSICVNKVDGRYCLDIGAAAVCSRSVGGEEMEMETAESYYYMLE